MKLRGILIKGIEIDKKTGKVKPKKKFYSVSAEIASRKKPNRSLASSSEICSSLKIMRWSA